MESKINTNNDFTNVRDVITNSVKLYGNQVAYKVKEKDNSIKEYTYNEVWKMVEALGTSLINMGLKGKRIAVIGTNSMQWELAYLSVVCGVGVVVPLDKTLPPNELGDVVKRSGVEAVFCCDKHIEVLRDIKFSENNNLTKIISLDAKEHSRGIYSIWALIEYGKHLLKENYSLFETSAINPYATGIMLFTSGTTSKSKVVQLSQYNICSNLIGINKVLDVSTDDVFLSFLPLHHVFECTVGFLFPLSKGATIVFAEGARRILKNLREYKVTFFACVPAIYEKLFTHVRKSLEKQGVLDEILRLVDVHKDATMEEKKEIFAAVHNMLGGNVRYFISGAASLNAETEQRYRNVGVNLMQAYGLTETSPVVTMSGNDCYRLGSVGKALPGVEAKVVDCDDNGVGELVVKGPNVMLGYYDNPEETNEAIVDGWFHTGDQARIDEDGYVFICGRKKNVIVLKNGKNVFPEEIEQMVNKIDGVVECVVYGREHSKNKDDVRVFVKIVYNPEVMKNVYQAVDEKQIYNAFVEEIKVINRSMPSYKAIRGVVITDKPFDKTSTGKIKRKV